MTRGDDDVRVPKTVVESTIQHADVARQPTVFEKVLLLLAAKFSSDPSCCQWSVVAVGEQILGIPKAQAFLGQAYQSLVRKGLMDACEKSAIEDMAIADLFISRRGADLLQLDGLPRRVDRLPACGSPSWRHVYILDTNVLIDEPNVFRYFGDDERVIVCTTVLNELDRLKIHETKRAMVNAAVQRIAQYARKPNFLYENADVNLLPADLRTADKISGDDLILSVALKYRNEPTTVITSDNLFILKLVGQGLCTVTLQQFMQSRH